MRFTALAVLGAWMAASAVHAALPSREEAEAQTVVPNRYIVEFDTKESMKKAGLKRTDTELHERMYSNLRARGLSFSIEQEYTADLFVGASITVSSEADLQSLASTEGILNIIPVRLVSLPDRRKAEELKWTHSVNRESLQKPQSANVSRTASTTAAPPAVTPSDLVRNTGFSNLPQIGADRVHSAGNKGAGVKVGIIDGGVDYTRLPLGGCFGPGCKVAGGYDFVGDAFTGANTPVPDSDPLDKCDSHGSTVAGIIGANDNEYGVPGVAPDASLYVYRAYGCVGSSTDDIVFQAMQRAYVDDVDVLSLSLGSPSGWTATALSVMASRLVNAGMIVVAAAGNDAAAGPFRPNAPATGRGVIGVGGVNTTVLPAHNATTSTGYGPITYYNYRDFVAGTYPVYTYPDDPFGCDPPWVDLTGLLLVLREGGPCDDLTKAYNAYDRYGDRILYVKSADTEPTYYDYRSIDGADVNTADGEYLIANAGQVSITFSYNPAPQYNRFSAGRGSYFSNQGPTNDLYLSTEVLAPGSNIIGVAPWNPAQLQTNWTISPGTSWSTAFGAGSAALYVSAQRKNVKPRDVREALQATSNPVTVSASDSQLLTVAHQGAGVLNVFDAINTPSVITPSELLLNDTAFFASRQTITITNKGRSERTYRIQNVAAGTALALNPSTNYTNVYPVPQVSNGAQVRASASDASFKLKAGKSRKVELTFTAPTGLDPKTLPIYSGYIQVSSADEVLTVPYLGVARRMRDNPVFDSTSNYFGPPFKLPFLVDWASSPQGAPSANRVFTFQGNDYPGLYYRFNGGSPAVYLDLVRADANLGLTPNFNKRSVSGSDLGNFELVERESVGNNVVVEERNWTPAYPSSSNAMERRKVQSQTSDWSTGLTGLQRLLCRLSRNKFKFCQSQNNQGSFARVPIVGNLIEQTLVVRNRFDPTPGAPKPDYQVFQFRQPNLANGTRVPNGSYRFLFRGLKVTGDASKQEDYETYLSAPFGINA